MLAREDLLWARAVKVSQQALSQRFLSFPAELFERVLKELLVPLNQRWQQRQKRKNLPSLKKAREHFQRLWATWLFYVVLIDLADEVADE
ncbi:MAG: hypothetical protein SW833_12590 [Cyanobacteriota bacterium]|nr:hypothetical protein [Cyanobacteriota bacterium]